MNDHFPGSWTRVCRVDDIPDEQALRLDTTPPVSVFRSDGELFCVDDTCSHETFSLAEGWIEEKTVECPLHMAKFCLRTGAVLAPPATQALRTHQVRVEDGDVFVLIDHDRTARTAAQPEGVRNGVA
ncbi:bifunctional 3-phenylpropionate/cinnamic acid dioxygenase ferredoxin subunit [Streptomyces vastus]|uniref:Rieske domain-containing protein n=1 Tax=Streptomyces vastus TaxID=285451 RepID=A0ABN3R892_9ACTN